MKQMSEDDMEHLIEEKIVEIQRDLGTFGLDGKRQTGVTGQVVHEHGAGAALAPSETTCDR